MRMSVSLIIDTMAQEWYVLCAYFGTFILLEIQRHGERAAMYRVARHALWAASVVIALHASIAATVKIQHEGLTFSVFDYAMVMILLAAIVYYLGHLFEQTQQSA